MNQDLDAKITRFRQMVEAQENNELARYSLASALFEKGEFEEAEPHFARALELKDDWVMAYILRARCLIRMRQYDAAKELLHKGREYSIQQNHQSPVEEIDELLEDLPG